MTDIVSVVIPTHNRRALLERALQSVAEQTYQDLEIVVVDDGSTDDTAASIARQHPHVALVRHSSARGPSAARNAGVAVSSGRYVFFLDDDDLIHPDHIRELLAATRVLDGADVVSGRWRRFWLSSSDVVLGPVMCCAADQNDIVTLTELLEPMGEGTICSHSVLWPRSLVDEIQFDEQLFTNGDVDFFGRAVLAGCHIVGQPVGMAYYRMHDGIHVAGTASDKSLLSSTRYRLAWSDLLAKHPDRDHFAGAMRNAFMSLLMTWSAHADGDKWRSRLDAEFRAWGGQEYYLPAPPRNAVKRLVAQAALRVGGPGAVAVLASMPRLSRASLPVDGLQRDRGTSNASEPAPDAQIIARLA